MEMLLSDGIAGFAYVDLNYNFVRVNQILAGIYGRRRDDLIGRHVSELVGDAGWDKVKSCLQAASSGATVLGVRACEDRPDSNGVIRHRVSSFFPIRTKGRVIGIAAVIHDVTDRVLAEQAMRESEARYRLLAETIPHLVWIRETEGTFLYVNQRLIDYTGTDLDEINRRTWPSYIAREERDMVIALWNEVRETGLAFDLEYRIRRYDGVYRWFLVRGVPLSDEKGDHLRWLCTCTDINDHKKAERTKAFLDELSERMRARILPDDILSEVVTSLGTHLGANRCGYGEVNIDAGTMTIRQEYCAPGFTNIVGTYPWEAFAPGTTSLLAAGKPAVVSDRETDPRIADYIEFYRQLHLRAFIAVPIIRNGVYVATLSVVMADKSRDWHNDELALVQIVAERTWLAIENARLYREKQQADANQQLFVREMLSVVTDGRLHVCETENDLPQRLPVCGNIINLAVDDGIRKLRHAVRDLALKVGFSDLRSSDLMTAVSEAAMNAVVHAHGGHGWVCTDDAGTIQVWVVDQGTGILMENLPHATLVRGYSTASTLGHGFKMIIGSTDRVHLLTNASGTTIVIEHFLTPPERAW